MNKNIQKLIYEFQPQAIHIPIEKCELEETVDLLFNAMFPICAEPDVKHIRKKLEKAANTLLRNITKLTNTDFAESIVEKFFERFPLLRDRLYEDAHCYLQNDPAAKSLEEVILAYPGFFALSVYRMAHELHTLDVSLIPRLFSEYAHAKVGIDIHPGAKIGKNLFMDHGTGIVIGETTKIGDNVKIYQGVTLGALYLEKKLSGVKRHPTVEDNVVIYSNATILGGETVIGHDSTIGGGAWVTQSVLPYSLVYNAVDVKVKTVKNIVPPNDFVI